MPREKKQETDEPIPGHRRLLSQSWIFPFSTLFWKYLRGASSVDNGPLLQFAQTKGQIALIYRRRRVLAGTPIKM
jgi:hypothetical protein